MRAAYIFALRFALVGIALPVPRLWAQSANELLAIETAAAKAAVAREPWRVDTKSGATPALVLSPVTKWGQDRSEERTAKLAERLGAKIGRTADVSGCDPARLACPLLIIVTEPIVDGDSARVTVSSYYRNPREGYETVEFLLVRRTGSWAIVRTTQIGIS